MTTVTPPWYRRKDTVRRMKSKNVVGFAVYGTLRQDEPNQHRWRDLGYAVSGRFHVEGFCLLRPVGWPFPYAVPTRDQGDYIVVDFIQASSSRKFHKMLQAFDWLEGYPTHYDRSLVEIKDTETGKTAGQGWIYIAAKPWNLGECEIVPHGDWKTVADRQDWLMNIGKEGSQ